MSEEIRDPEDVIEEAAFEAAMEQSLSVVEPESPLPTLNPFPDEPEEESSKRKDEDFKQWALGSNGRFSPVGGTAPKLPAGVYEPFAIPGNWGVERLKINSDEIYELPEMATNEVIKEAEIFWANEHLYRKHNLLYKRGIILWGPPGGGKTVAIKLLVNKLVQRDGIVLVVNNVALAMVVLKAVRRIEPHRNLITIFEDIDEIMYANGESQLLSMLDGENNVDRVLNIATTNYADKLGPRIINRPSRFDRRVYVGMPSAAAREYYLRKATAGELSERDIRQWVEDTDSMSIAHLRELVASVYCLGQNYSEVVERLADMAKQVKVPEEFRGRTLGFAQAVKRKRFGDEESLIGG